MLEKTYFEDLFGMETGYVMDFSNAKFAAYIADAASIDIYDERYAQYGDSKAKRLRAFWDIGNDQVVGKVLSELLRYWNYRNPEPSEEDSELASECRKAAQRLLSYEKEAGIPEEEFLRRDLSEVSFDSINVDASLIPILESRFAEAQKCLENGAPLSAIFMCGSILEGLLLGIASANPKEFNTCTCSPKDSSGKVKRFHRWSLAQFIDVACQLDYLTLDVQKFSHALRDFRNYIHPYEQMRSSFAPDEHTAEICVQVLRAAVASLSGER
jgi:hypothetical protein